MSRSYSSMGINSPTQFHLRSET
ncbi:hypothetical protein LINPERPRIM_LOCUS35272 [Linum perenne]